MALTITDDATILTKPINAVFQQTFLRRAQQLCPYFVGTQPGTISKQAGTSTVKWRRIEQLAPSTAALSELTGALTFMGGRSSVTPTFTDVLATVSKYGQFYIVNEEVNLYEPNGTANELVGTLGESAGRSLNELMRNVSEGQTVVFASGVASLGAVVNKIATGDLNFTINALARNVAMPFTGMTSGALEQATVPILPAFWGICHPDVAVDIASLTGFTGIQSYSQQVSTLPGEFGYYSLAGYGVRFVQTTDASIGAGSGGASTTVRHTSSNADTYLVPIYGRDAMGSVGLGQRHTDGIYRAGDNTGGWEIINHPMGSAGAGDPFNEISTIAYKIFFAGAVLNSTWGRAINCAASLLTA